MENITLWNGKTAPRIGIGTWVMGGEQYWNGKSTGWAGVDDNQSIATLHQAFDMGVRIIDTADQYGGGHAEKIIAKAIKSSNVSREEFVICTKVGMTCDPDTGDITGVTDKKDDIVKAIDASLKRLDVEQLDLVKFHLNNHPLDQSQGVFEAFADCFESGKIAGYGWSNDNVEDATSFDDHKGYVAVQHSMCIFKQADEMTKALVKSDLWAFNRQPLAMGLLTGKYNPNSQAHGKDDIRGSSAEWMIFFDPDGAPSKHYMEKVEQIRTLLTSDGRSLAQGALGWCLARSDKTIPLPGCRTEAQAIDNFGVLEVGPLSDEVMSEIAKII